MWRYRGGKSLAWTSDAKDRWASEWVTWPEFKKFWGQATRWVMRSRKPGVLNPRVAVENGVGRVSVDAVNDRGEFVNFLQLDASVMTPGLDAKRLTLRQTGAGHYEAEFDAREVGTYLASVTGDKVDPATAGASVGYPPEYRSLKPNQILMEQITAATGGRMSPATKDFFRHDGARVQTVRGLWYHLLWLALLLFLADIAARRLFLDDEQRAQIRAFFRRLVPARAGRGDRRGGGGNTRNAEAAPRPGSAAAETARRRRTDDFRVRKPNRRAGAHAQGRPNRGAGFRKTTATGHANEGRGARRPRTGSTRRR